MYRKAVLWKKCPPIIVFPPVVRFCSSIKDCHWFPPLFDTVDISLYVFLNPKYDLMRDQHYKLYALRSLWWAKCCIEVTIWSDKSFVGVPDRPKRIIYCQHYKPYFKWKPALLTLVPCECTLSWYCRALLLWAAIEYVVIEFDSSVTCKCALPSVTVGTWWSQQHWRPRPVHYVWNRFYQVL